MHEGDDMREEPTAQETTEAARCQGPSAAAGFGHRDDEAGTGIVTAFGRRPAPLLSFIIEEAALRRPIGGRTTLRGQWEKMLRLGQFRNVEIQIMPTEHEDHAALGGPFTLIDASTGQRVAYTEVQDDSRLYTDRSKIRELETRYGILRSQALTPRESSTFVERLLGEA
ncbi:hypothetical protein KBZ10_06025 [Streptomyces sp. F63]|uniref:DUF5753 domain-containing protein n=1 Tax=Streptomyces sp. F63 TaxID=2824887 RepID=UPI001B38EC27|nr:DUF5753 domain-containing protein [Streptomyces sp. F63]MBQ0984089.1 hypothetical protein [Streptomyces sp. F63]